MDMREKIFEGTSYGKSALKKFGVVSENFRIYECRWMGEKPSDWYVMECKGAEFREAKRGINKGKLSIIIEGTERVVYVTKDEM